MVKLVEWKLARSVGTRCGFAQWRTCLSWKASSDRVSPASHMYDSKADLPRSCRMASSILASFARMASCRRRSASMRKSTSMVLPVAKNARWRAMMSWMAGPASFVLSLSGWLSVEWLLSGRLPAVPAVWVSWVAMGVPSCRASLRHHHAVDLLQLACVHEARHGVERVALAIGARGPSWRCPPRGCPRSSRGCPWRR